MQSRWENANHLQSEAADLHQPHHLMMKKATKCNTQRKIYDLSESPESHQAMYNLQLPRMIRLNAFKCFTNSRTSKDTIHKRIVVHLLYTQLLGKKKIPLGNKHEIHCFWRKQWEWESQFRKKRDWPQTRNDVRWDANFLYTGDD